MNSDRVRFIGVDEAGLGPYLGPLALGGVAFDAPIDWLDRDWWAELAPTVARDVSAAYPIDDSKQIFGAKGGREAAARTVAGVLGSLPDCAGKSFACLESLLDRLAVGCLDDARAEHWFDDRTQISLVADEGLKNALEQVDLCLADAAFDLLFPRRFNRLLSELDNKAGVQHSALLPLLTQLLSDEEAPEKIRVVVDRLGGRKFYRLLVEEIAGDAFVMTSVETDSISRYIFELNGKEIEITFGVGADGFSLPTALASIVAKYLRECSMAGFNAFWSRIVPGIKPTAGYPGDAQRFRKDVASRFKELKLKPSEFWRNR